MAARMGPLVLPRTPYAVSSARNNFKIDRYLNFSTGQISDRYWGGVTVHTNLVSIQSAEKQAGKNILPMCTRLAVLESRLQLEINFEVQIY